MSEDVLLLDHDECGTQIGSALIAYDFVGEVSQVVALPRSGREPYGVLPLAAQRL